MRHGTERLWKAFQEDFHLKNRTNIVLTHNQNYKVKDAIIVHSIEELLEELKKYPMQKMFTASAVTPSTNSFFHIATWHR